MLDDVIEGVGVLSLEIADAVAELGEGDGFQDFGDGIAHLLHDAADAASLFVGARTFFVELFADAMDGGERAFDETDDFGEGDAFRRTSQAITAGDASPTFDDAGAPEVVEDLFEEPFGDVLLIGNLLDTDD